MRRMGLVIGLAFVVAACGGDDTTADDPEGEPTGGAITVSSPAFADQAPIPIRYTCDDRGVPPALMWDGVPDGASSLALVVHDPDAPSGTFVHWTVWDIPVDATGFTGSPPPVSGAKEGTSDANEVGYLGPCPPAGAPHRYIFTLYALEGSLGLQQGASVQEVLSAINSREIASGTLTGTYARS